MDDSGGKVDHRFETCAGFVAAHGNAFEFFDFAEEVFDQMPPFVDFQIDIERVFAPRRDPVFFASTQSPPPPLSPLLSPHLSRQNQ